MLLVGLLLGFVGAGGSGFMIAILTVGFGIPLHLAMGTALAAMMLTSLAGAASQLRRSNVDVVSGIWVGLFGAVAAWFGTDLAFLIPPSALKWLTAGMLMLSGVVLWLRLTLAPEPSYTPNKRSFRFAFAATFVGLITGFLSGAFGIGSTPFIQIGLMLLLGVGMRVAAGTSMLVILPIAAAGGAGFYQEDSLDWMLLLTVLAGSMTGSYIGARFTKFAPAWLLKAGMIGTPMAAACVMVL
jgi:uncharacterized membrane protein YfcA